MNYSISKKALNWICLEVAAKALGKPGTIIEFVENNCCDFYETSVRDGDRFVVDTINYVNYLVLRNENGEILNNFWCPLGFKKVE